MGASCCKTKIFVPEINYVEPVKEDEDYVEQQICKENDIAENEMKNFDIGDSKVLVVKQNGKIHAIGAKCSHYGAFLSTGALGNGRVRCPWHGACFSIETGDIEDYPGLDSVPCFQVKTEQGQVKIRAKKTDLESYKRAREMTKWDPNNQKTFVVIGGGPSGLTCCETLRQNGFSARIILICKEHYLPYDRVKLSKMMDSSPDSLLLRPQEFYNDNEIETLVGVEAKLINFTDKEITLDNGNIVKYDKTYIATGASALMLNIPGLDLKNVFTLRYIPDAQAIVSKLTKDSHVVVLGTSFTGMEAAAFCVKKAASVKIVGVDKVPFQFSFGLEIGQRIMKLFEEEGIDFAMENEIKKCVGNANSEIESVELKDGRVFKADILIVACGVRLNTKFLSESGMKLNRNGSVDTNEYLETEIQDVYVGGDIANSPIYTTGSRETIGHYPLAQYHGRIAALNMCGMKEELKAVPFFWSKLFDKSFRYAGHHSKVAEIKIVGSLEDLKFVAFYINEDGKINSISSCNRDPVVAQFAEFLTQGKYLTKSDIERDAYEWTKLINN